MGGGGKRELLPTCHFVLFEESEYIVQKNKYNSDERHGRINKCCTHLRGKKSTSVFKTLRRYQLPQTIQHKKAG